MNTQFDEMMRAAMDRVDQGRRAVTMWIVCAGVFEASLLAVCILIADWSDPLHRLVFFASMLVYGTLGIGLLALGSFIHLSSLRVLQGIESQSQRARA